MALKKSEQKIFTVVWESNINGEIFFSSYSCDRIDVAIAKFAKCKEQVLSKGHFADKKLDENCVIEDANDHHYFIKDEYEPYYENIYIIESNLLVKSE